MNLKDDQSTEHQQSPTTSAIEQLAKSVDDTNKQTNDSKLNDDVEEISIYDIRTKFRRNLILLIIALTIFLIPFCDTIYLPALNYVAISFNTSVAAVALSVSIYLLMIGLCSLLWGTLSDRFGRKIIMIVAMVIFIVASIVCVFAPTITALIIFRAIEGASIVGPFIIAQSLVGDIYPPEQRGTASGFLFAPFNIGPIVGPLIGGPLSDAFGWRSTFVLLTIYGVINVVVLFILIPETHQYFAKEHFHKVNSKKRIIDALPNEKPTFKKPWQPLVHLIDLTLLPYICLAGIPLATIFSCMTLFPIYLAEAPYFYTQTTIGLLYIPCGVSLLLGSLCGGWLSDRAGKYYEHEKCLEGRLVPVLVLSVLTPVGLVIYGWIFQYQLTVVGAIIGQVLIGFSQSALEVSVSAYITIKKQKEAAAACAALTFFYGLCASLLVTFAVPMQDAMGSGPYFTLLSGLNVIVIVLAGVLVYKNITTKGYISM